MNVTAAVAAGLVGLVAGMAAARIADADTVRRGAPAHRPRALVELVTAAAFAAVATSLGAGWGVVPYTVLLTALAAVSVTDLRTRHIPNRVVVPAAVLLATSVVVAALALHEPNRIWWAATGSAAMAATLLAVHRVAPDGMGLGDVKLAGLLGAGVGWLRSPWPDGTLLVVWVVLTASVLGLAGALVQRPATVRGRDSDATGVAFAPALSVATVAVVLLSDQLLR